MILHITLDESDPVQSEAINILQQIKKGHKGRVIGIGISRLLSDHGIKSIATQPDVAAQFLELVSQNAIIPDKTFPTSIPVVAIKEKKKRRTETGKRTKNKSPAQQTADTEIAPAPSPAPAVSKEEILKENSVAAEQDMDTTPAPVPDNENGNYPWRTPDGRVRMLGTEEAEKLAEEHPDLVDQYVRELHDWLDAHPEDRPTL